MAFDVVLAFYLNQGAVRDFFARPGPVGRSAAISTTPRPDPDARQRRPTSSSCAPTSRSSATTAASSSTRPAVEGYLAECDLLVGTTEDDARVLLPKGEVTAASLARYAPPPGESLYLRLVQKPLGGVELARWRLRPDRVRFSAPGRLARVGLFARLIDAGFTASLLLRGSVPGGTAAAAQIKYEARAGGRPALRLPRARRPRARLDLPPLPVLLLHERLPLHVLRGQRPRGRLGAGLHLPRGRARRPAAGLDRGGRARLHRRRAAAPLGRPDAREGRRPLGHQRRRRLACLVLRARRVPHRGAHPGPARARQLPRRAARVLARHAPPARPGRPAARRSRARSASRSSTTRAATASPSGRAQTATWTPVLIDETVDWVDGYRGPLRARHPRPVRRGARPGGTEVHACGHGAPVVERPARVRRPGQVGAAVARAGGHRRADRRSWRTRPTEVDAEVDSA